MDRFRLIASIVVLFIYCLVLYPAPTIITAVILVIGFLLIKNIGNDTTEISSRTVRRRAALNSAKLFLAPYNDIWGNLKLSNKYCSLRLGANGYTITARETNGGNRSFIVTKTSTHSREELWDLLCTRFGHNTNFDELIEQCKTFQATIEISGNVYTPEVRTAAQRTEKKEPAPKKEKLDVNNASEIELTALPGISIVTAKKLVKKREEIGGFKTVNDIFVFLQIKPHMQAQLESLICVKK